MFVCVVSQRGKRPAIAVDIAEAAAALDAPGIGNIVFATLIDDPANVLDTVDAFTGEVLTEAASASDNCDVASGISVLVDEPASATDTVSVREPLVVAADVAETSSPADTPDGTVVPAFTPATWDSGTVASVTLSSGNLVATNTGTTSTNQGAHAPATAGKTTGKYYFEMTMTTYVDTSVPMNRTVGVGTTASTYAGMGSNGTTGAMFKVLSASNNIFANGSSVGISLAPATAGSTVGIAVDLGNGKIWFRITPSGTWNNSGSADPASNVGGVTLPAGTMVPFVTFGGTFGTSGNVVTANFGASAFNGATPSGFTPGWSA